MPIDSSAILQRNMKSVPFDDFNESNQAIDELVANAVAVVQKHIGQLIEPTEYTQIVDERDYTYVKGIGYQIITARMPVISAPDASRKGSNWLIFDDPKTEFTFTAGWESLPDDMANVIYNLVMYEFNRTQGNSFGVSTQTQQTGGVMSTVMRSVEDFYRDELKRLDKYVNKSYFATVYVNE